MAVIRDNRLLSSLTNHRHPAWLFRPTWQGFLRTNTEQRQLHRQQRHHPHRRALRSRPTWTTLRTATPVNNIDVPAVNSTDTPATSITEWNTYTK